MSQKVIAINAGSSSLKFQLFEMPEETIVIKGLFERIGLDDHIQFSYSTDAGKGKSEVPGRTHDDAVKFLLHFLLEQKIIADLKEIVGVGHRIVHGGEMFKKSSLVGAEELKAIKDLGHLAPLHNPVNAIGIEAFEKDLPGCPQVAVFDTSFHQTMEPANYIYPIPYKYYQEDSIRRYGFHGTSHQFVSQEAAKLMGKPLEDSKIVVCHLGNGASCCGVKNGQSIVTSMGFTPLAGLMMGTRCGDIDPSIIPFLEKEKGMTPDEIATMMNNQSGFLGVSELSSDSRDIEDAAKEGHEKAQLAEAIFTTRVRQTIGAYAAEMGGIDAIVFTAGIGENAPGIREESVKGLEFLGAKLDTAKNSVRGTVEISTDDSAVKIYMIPTNEEVMIARDTFALIK